MLLKPSLIKGVSVTHFSYLEQVLEGSSSSSCWEVGKRE